MTNKDFEIGIIGGTGEMGKWCAEVFRRQGYVVHQSGRTMGMSMEEMADRCAVVVVSVPMESTADVIQRLGPLMGEGSLLMDLTSLKEEPVRLMLASTRAEVVGCHPLFGPLTTHPLELSVVLCPARVDKWASWPGEVFWAARVRVIETTPEHHDRVMAVVQGMNHLNTLLMSMLIRECGIGRQELEHFATPLFRSKLFMVDRVTSGNARMYAEIMAGNPHVPPLLDRYGALFGELAALVSGGDGKALAERMDRPNQDLDVLF